MASASADSDSAAAASAAAAAASALPPILTGAVARRLLDALARGAGAAHESLDLGRTEERVEIADGAVVLGGAPLAAGVLERLAAEDERCFEVDGGAARPIAVQSPATGWVRSLLPTADAPTTLVAGFAMHRLSGTTPLADTRSKVRALGAARGAVLDTATGLGYTAIALAKRCREVVTVELDPAAIELARRNPWSRELFDFGNIERIVGDAARVVEGFPDGRFSAVLHDPPTVELGGELYGAAFYAQLRRVLKPGGRLFHYTGDPASVAGGRTARGVMRRLAEAGFADARRDARAFGIVARASASGRPAPRRSAPRRRRSRRSR